MKSLLTKNEVSALLAIVDKKILEAVKRRMELSVQAGRIKCENGERIVHAGREQKRIADAKSLAVDLNLNPNFVASLLYLIIGESCKLQMIELQTESPSEGAPQISD